MPQDAAASRPRPHLCALPVDFAPRLIPMGLRFKHTGTAGDLALSGRVRYWSDMRQEPGKDRSDIVRMDRGTVPSRRRKGGWP